MNSIAEESLKLNDPDTYLEVVQLRLLGCEEYDSEEKLLRDYGIMIYKTRLSYAKKKNLYPEYTEYLENMVRRFSESESGYFLSTTFFRQKIGISSTNLYLWFDSEYQYLCKIYI